MKTFQIHHTFDTMRRFWWLLWCMAILLPCRAQETIPTRSTHHALTSAYILDIWHNWDKDGDGDPDNWASFWLRQRGKRIDGAVISAVYKNWTLAGEITFVARGKFNRTTPAIINLTIQRLDRNLYPDPRGIPYVTIRAYQDMQPGSDVLERGTVDLLWGAGKVTPIKLETYKVQ